MTSQKSHASSEFELINVSDLNQFLYCPRRYWYLEFYDTQGRNVHRIEGKLKHEGQTKRGGWIREQYFESKELGLKGKIDLVDQDRGRMLPVERKRGSDYYYNDEVQLAAYCMLLTEATGEKVEEGVIYLYGTDQRISILIEEHHQQKVRDCAKKMRNMAPDDIPDLVDNPNKCEKCSTRQYCMPMETAMLEPEKAEGTGWEDVV